MRVQFGCYSLITDDHIQSFMRECIYKVRSHVKFFLTTLFFADGVMQVKFEHIAEILI